MSSDLKLIVSVKRLIRLLQERLDDSNWFNNF
jgi:hypothetical protein